jgi:hypothetical protein
MMQRKGRPVPEGKIEKPEDKDWQQWYSKLSNKEHNEYLAKLGLDGDDIKDWEGHHVLDELSTETQDAQVPVVKPVRKK